jgi:hypothetical protein
MRHIGTTILVTKMMMVMFLHTGTAMLNGRLAWTRKDVGRTLETRSNGRLGNRGTLACGREQPQWRFDGSFRLMSSYQLYKRSPIKKRQEQVLSNLWRLDTRWCCGVAEADLCFNAVLETGELVDQILPLTRCRAPCS